MRGSSLLMCWWMATMLMPSLRIAFSTVCSSLSVIAKSPSTTASLVGASEGGPGVDAHLLADRARHAWRLGGQ